MEKKILIIGNGPNAYALAKKLSEQHKIYITPASDTLNDFAQIIDIREDNVNELLEFVLENQIDMTIPVSAKSINTDIASIFANNGQSIFAPQARCNELVTNKVYAKKTLYKLHIPTPKFGIFEKENLAIDYIKSQKIPFVIKTNDSGSATVLTSALTAKNIINSTFAEKNKKLIIEDYVYGTPFSYYAVTDGYKALPFGNALIYKHSLDGDGGQLTDGMGACAPDYKLSIDDEYYIMDNIIYPALGYLEANGAPYLGIIGVNGVKSEDGKISILGWNSFLQNADAAAVLENIDEDIYSLFEACIIGSFSDEIEVVNTKEQYSVSLTLTNKNKMNKENAIKGIDNLADDIKLTFYPSVQKNKYLEYEANSGSVLILTASAPTVTSASNKVYDEAECINYIGKNYRTDVCRLIHN